MRKFYTALLLTTLVFIASESIAQTVNLYGFTQSNNSYTPITGGTVLTTLVGTTYADDQVFLSPTVLAGSATTTGVGFPIGFNFTYAGDIYNQFAINNNGWISLGKSALTPSVNTASTSAYTPLSSTTAITPTALRARIAGVGRDLQAQAGAELRFETIGAAPNRKLVIQWTNYKRFGTAGTGDNFNFQIILNETSNAVQVMYGDFVFGTTSTTSVVAHIGLGGFTATDFNNRRTIAPHDWNATSTGATNADGAQFLTTTIPVTPPANGLLFTWNPPAGCSGTPAGGTATSSAASYCANQPFTLDVTGATVSTGLTYQWQSSANGTTWTDISGATTSSYTVASGFTGTVFFRRRIACGANAAFSSSIQLTQNPFFNCYCTTSSASSAADEDIFNVTVGSLNQTSDCSTTGTGPTSVINQYSDYTTGAGAPAAPGLRQGLAVPFSIQIGTCGGNFNNGVAIYLDYNQNGSFDAWERMFITQTATVGPNTVTGSFVLPDSALIGVTRMRVVAVETGTPLTVITPCASYTWGETEDYLVNILAGIPCTTPPTAGTTVSSAASVCIGVPFTLSTTGSSSGVVGLSYQWQVSTDGGVTWSDIAGARDSVYVNPGISASAQFRRRITCSGNNSFSTPLTISIANVAYATLPYTESFENTWLSICATRDVPNNFWRATPVTGENSWRRNDDGTAAGWANAFGNYTPEASIGAVSARFHSYGTVTGTKGSLNLYFNGATASPTKRLQYDFINSIGTDSLTILLSTDGGATFVRLDSARNSTVWRTKTIVFTTTSATSVLRFEGTGLAFSSDIGLDNINLIDFPACSGTPIGGTATTTTNPVCPGVAFTIAVTGATDASGITYQWEQSTNGGTTWTPILNATGTTYTSNGITTTTSFRRVIYCGAASSTSTVLVVTLNAPTYAVLPFSESFENTWINGCGLRDIPNNSWRNIPVTGNHSWRREDDGDAAGWTNSDLWGYTPPASVGAHSARFHSAEVPLANRLTDTGRFELYINAATASPAKRLSFDYINTSGTDSLTISLSTDGGITFVRLDSARTSAVWRSKVIDFTSASATTVIRFLGTGDFGTTDIGIDNVLVTDFAPCAGVPTGGTTVSSANPVCSEPFTLSLQGSSSGAGLTYQWQTSTNGTTWTDVAGATGFTFVTSQVGTTFYRARITCTISSDFAYSTPVQVVSPALVSGTFTINNTLTTSVPPNFKSFNDAYNYIRCGINGPVIFNVVNNAAPYNEQLIMAAVPGASATNTVTFRGQGSTISFASTNTNERAVIKLRNADYIRFDSLIINAAAGTYGYGVQLINNADSNVIRNCTIITNTSATTQNYGGIIINGTDAGIIATGTVLCDANQFLNNTITGGWAGITLTATLTSANLNNIFSGNTLREFYQHGIYVNGSAGTRIEGNTFTRPTRSTVTDFNGIFFTGISTRAFISKNRIVNPFGGALASTSAFTGISFTNTDATVDNENIVVNNLIGQVNGQGAQTGISNTSSDNVWYFHNTIALDSATSNSTATTRGFFQTTLAGGILFFNNMVTITRGGIGTKHAIYLGTPTTGFIGNYNNLYVDAPAGTANYVGFFNSNQTTINDWRAASGQDAASLSRNPFYVSPATANYMPSNGAVDNKGTPADIATDILNAPRSTATPDIGAYEFVALPCTLPPDAGNTIFNDTTVCQNSSVRLNLTVQTWGATQTFQWQTATSASGPWTNLGGLRDDPDTTIRATTTLFYRVAVTCGTSTVFSNALQLQVSPALPAGTYTINAGGTNTYVPGTAGGNFTTFNLAKAAMACGIVGNGPVVFNVASASGPYNEQLRLDSIPGTSAVNTITFNGNGNTISSAAMTNTERAIIKLSGTDHIIFDSLRIDASAGTTNGYGVQLQNNADSNTFRRCTILSSTTATTVNYAGIVINASESSAITTGNTVSVDGNRFDGNTITGGHYGITLMGGTTATTYIQNNRFTNNTISEFYGFGFYVGGTRGTLLEGNRFNRPTRANTAANVYGVYATSAPSLSFRISKNRFTRFFGGLVNTTNTFYGIYHNSVDATAGSEVLVTNNLIASIDAGSGSQYGFYNASSDNVFYYHNTISLDNTASAPSGASAGMYQTTAATGIFFRNNIITVRRGGTGTKHAIYMATATSEITASNNNYFVTGTNAYVGFRNSNQTTLAQWQAASGQDANSFSLNPLYADTANGNYRPQITGLDNKGQNVNVTTDIENVTRNTTTPDIGAYEFAPIGCQNPPTAGTASVTPTTGICLEVPISLNVTGHSPLGDLTFQWQSSADGTTGWTNISGVQYFPEFDTLSGLQRFYRAAVTCSGTTVYTNVVSVNLNPLLVTGTYTINKATPTNYAGVSGANFNSFGDAVTAMLCGVTGPVTFNVASDTYTEQVNIPYIRNTNATNTVTFQSASGNATDVTLRTAATTAANYTLQLDNTRWFTFRNMSFGSTRTDTGRVVVLVDSASNINLVGNRILAPSVTAAGTHAAGIFATAFRGRNVLVRRNTIQGGSAGIHYSGISAANLNRTFVADSNNVSGTFQYGIFASLVYRVNLTSNTVAVGDTTASPAYGIWASDADSGYNINRNTVTFSNTGSTRTAYGIYINNSDSAGSFRSSLMGNRILSGSGNNATLYGLYINNAPGAYVVNNVVGLNNTGAGSYGIYHNSTSFAQYLNNTVQSSATAGANNHAAYFNTTATSNVSIRNNVFSHTGGGRAMFVANASQALASDYNLLYTSGGTLVQSGTPAGNYANLAAWRNAAYWDVNSIVYQPALISAVDLRPDLTNPDVWAMHGRGVQIPGNNVDINGTTRSTTLTGGVPDLGAYEFLPTALPTVLNPTPATPAANTTQTFMYGTDTVMKITWGPTAPPTATVRRYSGVAPSGLTGPDSMFFYTQVDVGANRNISDYAVRLHYLDPWQGSIPDQYQLGLGKTIQQGSWVVGFPSRVDVPRKVIYQTGLNWVDKYTGLVNPYAIPQIPDKDSSNRGRRFWVAYPMNQLNGTQEMLLYLSATETANVQVRINGTNWVRNYIVPANTVRTTEFLPKIGADAAWVNVPGQSVRGISITSDVPIVAYSHVIGNTSSGASMLLPVGVWGYEYRTLGITQDYGLNSFSYYYVIADNDSTWVEITSQPGITLQAQNGAITVGTPSVVRLNKGEFYLVAAQSQTEELSGSRIRAVVNRQGKCFPIAVYSGSSRTAIDLGCGSGGDFIMQQNFPSTAWGLRYLTAPTSADDAANQLETNLYRVAVNDPTTVVRRNGTILTGLQRNYYYEFTSNSADVIEANKPIMVAQFMGGSCTGAGDPEMIYISPVEQGIKEVAFYRNTLQFITVNYLTAIVPTGGTGLSSFRITDGIGGLQAPDYTYPHSRPGYTVVVKRWTSAQAQVRVVCDSAFTAITYGQGSVESYGYNAGTLVKTLRAQGNINNTLSTTGRPSEFTCSGTPFRFTVLLPLRATSITFKLSAVPGLTPSADVTLTNPTPSDSTIIGGTKYYIYTLPTDYTFSQPGLYPVQVIWSHPDIESCDKTAQDIINVQVVPAPNAGFTYTPTIVCEGNAVQFSGETVTQNGVVVNQWQWTFHNTTTATGQNTSFTYPTAGSYAVRLRSITADGCLKDSVRTIAVNARPVVTLVADSLNACPGDVVTFSVQNPATGVVYSWYNAATGGNAVGTGNSFTTPAITANATYYVEGVSSVGCNSSTRRAARVFLRGPLPTPVPRVINQDVNSITFGWNAVTGAGSYEVSISGGAFVPANGGGTPALTHTVTGLRPLDTVSIRVRALGVLSCQTSISAPLQGRTLPDQIFIPNSFSPNGDGLNDRLTVNGYTFREVQFMVFNQWGEKVSETNVGGTTSGTVDVWDGMQRGKMQPSGVYVYVAKFTLRDGTTLERKGSINLVR